MTRPMRLRRSQLSVPGVSEKMIAKACMSDADHVFLDLEDAVAPSAKVCSSFASIAWSRETTRSLRNRSPGVLSRVWES